MELADIGRRAFDYGASLQKAGQSQQGPAFKRFAVGTSMLAYPIEDRGDLAQQVSTYARDIGDVETAQRFAALAAD
jgi:hypothetical protein